MAHARRKFFDAQGTDRERALTALAYIRLLYQIEREVKEVAPEKRLEIRQARSRPICERLKDWLDREILSVLPESPMGQAMKYAKNHWAALTRFLDSGPSTITPRKGLCGQSSSAARTISSRAATAEPSGQQ
jgi:hypothetical protein